MGRYGMQNIENKIIKNINKATSSIVGDSARIPFKLGRTKCVAVLVIMLLKMILPMKMFCIS